MKTPSKCTCGRAPYVLPAELGLRAEVGCRVCPDKCAYANTLRMAILRWEAVIVFARAEVAP